MDGRSYRLNDGGHHGQNALNGRHQSTHKRGDYRRQQRDYLTDHIRDHRHHGGGQLAQGRHERLNRRLKHLECLLQADENVLQHLAELRTQLRARGDKAGQSANHQSDGTAKTGQYAPKPFQHVANHRHATQALQSATKTSRAKQTSHGGDGTGQSRQLASEAIEIDFADLVGDTTEHFLKRRANLLRQCGHLVEKRGDERFDGLHHLDDRAADPTESRNQIIADRSLQASDLMPQDRHFALRGLRQGLVDAAEIRFQDLRGHRGLLGRATLLKDLLLRVGHRHAIFAQRGCAAGHDLAEQVSDLHAILSGRVIPLVVGDHVGQGGRQGLDLIGGQCESAELCLSGLQGATGYDSGLSKRLIQAEQRLLLLIRPVIVIGDLLEFRGHLTGLERRIHGLLAEIHQISASGGSGAGHDGGHALSRLADPGHRLRRETRRLTQPRMQRITGLRGRITRTLRQSIPNSRKLAFDVGRDLASRRTDLLHRRVHAWNLADDLLAHRREAGRQPDESVLRLVSFGRQLRLKVLKPSLGGLEVIGRRLEIVSRRLLPDLRLFEFDGRSLRLSRIGPVFLRGRVQLLLRGLHLHAGSLEFQQGVSILLRGLSHVLFKGLQSIGIQFSGTTVKAAFEGVADLLALLRPVEPFGKGVFQGGDGFSGLFRHILAEAIHLRENAHMRGTKLATASHDSLLYSLFLKPKMLLIDSKASRRSSSVTSTCCFPAFSGARSPRIDVPPA